MPTPSIMYILTIEQLAHLLRHYRILRDALSYRITRQVVQVRSTRAIGCYPVCPRCRASLEREYMSYCNCCGQRLGWDTYERADVLAVYRNGVSGVKTTIFRASSENRTNHKR